MLNWYKKQKERKEQDRINAKADCEQEGINLKRRISEYKNRMLEKPCAINRMEKCDSKCVHFQNGSTFRMPYFIHGQCSFSWMAEWPKCKLWK